MRSFFLLCLCLAVSVVNYEVAEVPAEERPVEMVASLFRLAEGDGIGHAPYLENSNSFREHLGHLEIGVITAHDGVDGGLVDDQVEGVGLELPHIGAVHGEPLHLWSLFLVTFGHLLNDHIRDVVVDHVGEPIVVEVLTELGIAAADHEDLHALVGEELPQAQLQRLVGLQPVEDVLIFLLRVAVVPVLRVPKSQIGHIKLKLL